MAKSLSVLSILLLLLLSLTSIHAQLLLPPGIVPSAAYCSNLNIIPSLSAAVPAWSMSPYQAIGSYYAASWASPYIYSNLAATSPYGVCILASPYISPYGAAAISQIGAYNVPTVAANPVVNGQLLNQVLGNQILVNQMQANKFLNQQQAN